MAYADGALSDRRVMRFVGDEDSLYFREEKFRKDTERRPYLNVYAASKTDSSIKYVWSTSRKNILTNRRITIEYYPDHTVKNRVIFNDKKKCGIKKTYDESGKLIGKVSLPE